MELRNSGRIRGFFNTGIFQLVFGLDFGPFLPDIISNPRPRPSTERAPSPNRLSPVRTPFPTDMLLPSLPRRSASPPLLPLRKVPSRSRAPQQREKRVRRGRQLRLSILASVVEAAFVLRVRPLLSPPSSVCLSSDFGLWRAAEEGEHEVRRVRQ